MRRVGKMAKHYPNLNAKKALFDDQALSIALKQLTPKNIVAA